MRIDMGKLLDRIESRWSLWTSLLGVPVVGAITAWLSTGVDWVNQFGAFGWWAAALVGSLIATLFAVAFAWLRYAWVVATSRSKWAEETEGVNPLAKSFREHRLSLDDIAHPISQKITGKTFYDCDLICSRNLYIHDDVSLIRNKFEDCTFMVLKADSKGMVFPGNATIIEATEFHGSTIWKANVLLPPNLVPTFLKMGATFATLTGFPEIDSQKPDGSSSRKPH